MMVRLAEAIFMSHWPLPPLRPKHSAYGVAGLLSGRGQRDQGLLYRAPAGLADFYEYAVYRDLNAQISVQTVGSSILSFLSGYSVCGNCNRWSRRPSDKSSTSPLEVTTQSNFGQ